ncbi:MAG TPA: DUF2637 domain-containing protein, partial [Pseudonocardia sp.]|nr:DUF2637 domain-containing protein [Pseudonocardia sp.]
DGFAVSMAGVAWAASLDARPAIPARLATVVAVGASSASNGVWAYLRAHHDMVTVVLGIAVPVAANLAFEVLLAELRRQVQRRRGLPPPVAVPYPRLIRIALAPWQTFRTWRAVVLEITAMDHAVARPGLAHAGAHHPEPGIPPAATVTAEATYSYTPSHTTPAAPTAPSHTTPSHTTPAAPTAARPAGVPVTGRAAAPVTRHHEAALPAAPAFSAPPAPSAPSGVAVQSGAAVQVAVQSEAAVGPHAIGQHAVQPHAVQPANNHTTNNHTINNHVARPTAPARPSEPARPAAPAAEPSRSVGVRAEEGSTRAAFADGDTDPGQTQDRRPIDPRVVQLAQHLASTEEADDLTGEMVGPLLNIDVAPRTGRRLLGQARELVNRRSRTESNGLDDPELSVIGGR